MKLLSSVRCFDGHQNQYELQSAALSCTTQFSVFLPPQSKWGPVPALYWLSGLTCTDQNFSTKAGAQRIAAQLGMALVMPDTSPRGDGVPDDAEGAYDFGLGAGFYVDATQAPWAQHYQMYSHVVHELPSLLEKNLPISDVRSISGHSMGGHGALTIALNNPSKYRSVSAFSPIVSPANSPWGQKAFGFYFGADKNAWARHDTVALILRGAEQIPMRIDQGLADSFLESQLKTSLLEDACSKTGYLAQIHYHPGYDHSYYFIASFIEAHLNFHAEHMGFLKKA